MVLKYIVDINLSDKTARARQVSCNGRAFRKHLGDKFHLIVSGGGYGDYISNKSVGIIKRESSAIRKGLFLSRILPDIISSNGDIIYSRNIYVLYLASMINKKVVWEIHDAIDGMNVKLFNRLRDKVRIVAISNALKEYLIKTFDFDKEKVCVAHDGVSIEDYDELRGISKYNLRNELSLPNDRMIVMHSGSLYKGRGAELFEVIARTFKDILFMHIGGTQSDIQKWKEYYSDCSNIIIVPHQSNATLIKYQMAADLLFLPMTKNNPIWWCTSPMKLFEYMATGIPILASNIGSVGEILNKENAIIFDPDNINSIVKGVDSFLANPRRSRYLASTALQQIREKYTWQKRVCSICDFLGVSHSQIN